MNYYSLTLLALVTFPLLPGKKTYSSPPKKHANTSKFTWQSKGSITKAAPHLATQMGVVETPGVKPLGYTIDGTTKVFRLTAQPITQTLTDGNPTQYELEHTMNTILGIKHRTTKQKIKAWGYNGSSPGPTLELIEGDKVRVIFKNELPEPTLIRWHGIEYPHELDKSSERNAILPGETFSYEFKVSTPGTYLYHSGYSIFKQNRFGLVGMLIVHPKNSKKIDRHIALLLQDWSIGSSNTPNTVSTETNWFTINGLAAPSIPRIVLNQDERVQLHIASLALESYPLQMHGHTWTLVGTEGGLIKPSAQVDYATLSMDPCTTRTIEFKARNPGLWPLYALTTHHCTPAEYASHGGMFTLVEVVPKDAETKR